MKISYVTKAALLVVTHAAVYVFPRNLFISRNA